MKKLAGPLAILCCLCLHVCDAVSTECDVVVAGGSTAALSAALSAAKDSPDLHICLTEPTDWLGGQLTSGGVPAIDFGTRNRFPKYQAKDFVQMLSSLGVGNPGNCWVSTKCYLPKKFLGKWINQAVSSLKNLTVFYYTVIKNVTTYERKITSVSAVQRFSRRGISPWKHRFSQTIADWYSLRDSDNFTKRLINFVPRSSGSFVVIEATELGDILVLANATFRQGVEFPDETSQETIDTCGQAFTFPFFIKAYNHSVPAGHWPKHTSQFYSLGEDWGKIWSYRRVRATTGPIDQAKSGEISSQNWATGNDYRSGYIFLSKNDTLKQRGDWKGGVNLVALSAAELQAYGWYWYYHERAPSYIANRVTLDAAESATKTGLSKIPYIRDSRRSVGNNDFMLTKRDLNVGQLNVNSKRNYYRENIRTYFGLNFTDSICLGDYFYADIHSIYNCIYPRYAFNRTITSFTIPFRSLTNKDFDNLLVSGKTMAQTFLANAATRLHPMEWGTGLSAGLASVMMSRDRLSTSDVSNRVARLQKKITKHMPIFWS